MPDALPPIDTSVNIPPSVKQAGEAADALHKALYGQQGAEEGPPPQEGVGATTPPGDPPPEPTPEPPHQPVEPVRSGQEQRSVPETGETGSWEHRYLAMKGRFDQSQQTLGQMQEQMSQLGDELMRTQQALQFARRGAQEQRPQRPQGPPPTVTPADVETYGPELVEFVTRAARGAVAPDLNQVTQQVRQTSRAVQMTAHQRMEAELDRALPDWRDINVSQRFKQWVRLRDVYSNQVRADLIGSAVQAADAPRVAAFFNAFLNEERATGQLPDDQQPQPQEFPAPRTAAVHLSSLASPGKAKPASGNGYAVAADKPVFTRAQIRAFYSNEGRQAYVGREDDRKRDEQEIYAAQREGRVR